MEKTRTNMPFESVASETVASTLIVKGTSSSQEKAEISATYSWSHSPERDHAVATIQKLYRGFRTRRNLADSIIAAELLWQTTLSDTQKMGQVPSVDIDRGKHIGSLLKWAETRVEKYGNLSRDQLALLHCWENVDPRLRYSWNSHFFYLIWGDQCFLGSWKFDSYKIGDLKRRESLFTTGKPTSVELRMDTTSSTQHGISELTTAWKTWKGALQRWLEVIDPRHRVGHNLNFYFQIWMTLRSGQPFFYWLDVGDGKTVDHLECSREKLRHERNTYLEQLSLISNTGSSMKQEVEKKLYVDSTLIVKGTSSSQEKAEISATYSWSHSPESDHAVATIQKLYRGFRTRRNLADSIIAAELLWQTTLSDIHKMGPVLCVHMESEKHIMSLLKWAETRVEKYGKLSSDQLALLHCLETIDPRLRYSQNSCFFNLIWDDQCFLGSWKFDSYKIGDLKRRESLFTTGKPTYVELRMDTTSSTQHGISELIKPWKTWKGALQRWLEVIDPRHRVGHNLNFYFQIWMTLRSGQPFFYWLDVGDGKTVEHLKCSREKLRHERNTYLEPASNSEAVESLLSLMLRSESDTEEDINNNQREHDWADGFYRLGRWILSTALDDASH